MKTAFSFTPSPAAFELEQATARPIEQATAKLFSASLVNEKQSCGSPSIFDCNLSAVLTAGSYLGGL